LHGLIASGHPYVRYRAQVASLQTIVNRLETLPEPEIIVIDEFHHAKSKSYLKILRRWPNAKILGLTATPERLDGKPLSDVCEHLIIGPPMRQLIDDGFLADYEYFAPEVIAAPEHKVHGDYNLDEVAAIMDTKAIIGNAVEHYRKYADGLPAIASCASIVHAEHVATGFREAGYKAQAVHSRMDQRDIDAALAGLRTGAIQIVTQCDLLGEGIDIPGVVALIGLRHTASLVVFLQHIGRVLRRSPGKHKALILDHVGNYMRHGLPDDPREWSLEGRKKKTPDPSAVKRCPECGLVVRKTVRVCPRCSFQWVESSERGRRDMPEEKEGTLARVERKPVTIIWEGLVEEIRMRARNLKEAIALAKSYGYKHTAGYAAWVHVLKKNIDTRVKMR